MATARTELSIYGLKDHVALSLPASSDGIIDTGKELAEQDVDLNDANTVARLYVPKQAKKLPRWAEFLRPAVPNIRSFVSSNAPNSVLLVLVVDGHAYAVALGYARHLLDEEVIRRRFGLRAALSIIDPEKMRQVGYKEVEARTLFGDLQSNQSTQFYNFSMNPDVQMLRGVDGGVIDSHDKWAKHAFGTDALQINPLIDVGELPRLLRWLARVESQRAYKQRFDWIDHVVEVTDSARTDALRGAVTKYIAGGGTGVGLGTPEPVDPTTGPSYHLGRAKPTAGSLPTLDLEHLRKSSVNLGSYAALTKHKIFVVDSAGDVLHKWPIWRCLSGQFRFGGEHFIIQDGSFFSVETAFEQKIDARLAPFTAVSRCPVWATTKHVNEAAYNAKALQPSLKAPSECLDAKCLTTYRGHGAVELCDVFEHAPSSTTLYFVKKYKGASTPISHLVAQASVTAEALREDPDFRNDAASKWPLVAAAFSGTFDPTKVEIRICIAARSKKPNLSKLPFFAKLTLVQRAERIRSLGYRVAIDLFRWE